jgi:hypothetical protein
MLGWAVLVLTLTGCSAEDIKHLGYNIGQQHACKQDNDDRPYESNNDLKCMSPAEQEGMSYDEYQQARSKQAE